MESILDFLRTDTFLIILLGGILILFVLYISNVVKLSKIRKDYNNFMKRLGNGNNVDEILRVYINEVERVANKNEEIVSYCKKLDENVAKCTQKIGMVRYNAFQDTGSNLSFAVALLDDKNTGIVINGIYSRDCSNIYSKPIENGKSNFILSSEEKEAIDIAIKSEGLYVIK